METWELMEAIATVIDRNKVAIGIEGASYPPLNYVPKSPWVMVRESLYAPGPVEKSRAGLQVVSASIDLVALIPADPMKPAEAARLDHIKHPLLDLFDANANGGNVNYAFTGILDESIDRVWNSAIPRRATLERWGETQACHALIITLDSGFKRKAVLP